MYVSRSDWKELVERLAAAERQAKENGYMCLKYQQELDRARELIKTLSEQTAKYQSKYENLQINLQAVLDDCN